MDRPRLLAGVNHVAIVTSHLDRFVEFHVPDGMRGEIAVIIDPHLRGIHEPRRLTKPVAGLGR